MCIGKRINKIRLENNLNQVDFSQALGYTQAAISRYINDKTTPESDFLKSLSKVYNVNINWLLTGEGSMFLSDPQDIQSSILNLPSPRARTISIPVVGEIAAGPPIEIYNNQEPLMHITLEKSLIPHPDKIICFRVHGSSMEPEIMHRDIILINSDFDRLALDHKICAFRVDGGITLKRLIYNHKCETTLLIPINQCYDPIVFHWEETRDIEIIGVLMFCFRRY